MTSKVFIGPTYSTKRKIFSFDSDESHIIFEEGKLDDYHKEKDGSYSRLNSPFMMSTIAISNKDDHIILDKNFENTKSDIAWHIDQYKKIGLEVSENIHLVELKQFTPYALELAKSEGIGIISPQGYSHSQKKHIDIESIIKVSERLNRKTNFPEISRKYNFPSPKNELIKASEILNVAKSYSFPKNPLYIKWDGIGGGNNVYVAKSENDLEDFIDENPDKMVMIQEKLNPKDLEIISEYAISNEKIELTGHIGTIIYGSQWNGGIYSPRLILRDSQQKALDEAAKGLYAEGFRQEEPLFCGFDVFLNKEGCKIVEINARWLGTSTAQLLLKRLGIYMKEEAICVFDNIRAEDVEKYMEFVEKNLYSKGDKRNFSIIPLGICAYVEADGSVMVFFLMIGDFDEFHKRIRKEFSSDSFTLMDMTKLAYKEWQKKLNNYLS